MQPSLLDLAPTFDGPDLTQADHVRLTKQQQVILAHLHGGDWWTLRCLSVATGAPEASVSAQLRNLRKVRFGAHTVERKHLGNGLYAYRLVN